MKARVLLVILSCFACSAMAQRLMHEPRPMQAVTETESRAPDTIVKVIKPMMPGFPRSRTEVPEDGTPVAGTLRVTTKISCEFLFDGQYFATMTPWHEVTIYGSPEGEHTLLFRNGVMEREKKILLKPKEAGYYMLRSDTTIADSVVAAKPSARVDRKVVTRYIPFLHAVSLQIRGGITFNGSGSTFQGKFIAGYAFSPQVSLGIGTGLNNFMTRFQRKYEPWNPSSDTYKSSVFRVSYVPIFLDLSVAFLKKRVSPILSIDAGLCLPLSQNPTGSITQEHDYYSSTEYFRVEKISTGGYMGIAIGVKWYINQVLAGQLSLGYDACFNMIKSGYNTNLLYQDYSETYKKLHVSSGFTLSLVIGINFGTG
ncbi:MAG: hypothetical protein WCO93_09100, partial [bacterium]